MREHTSVNFKARLECSLHSAYRPTNAKYCVLCLAHACMESQDLPGPSAGPVDANGLEDHVGISLVNRFRNSNSAPQDSASFGSQLDDDTSTV
eukprot:347245-Chlamydomonas_euryale.AAC.1